MDFVLLFGNEMLPSLAGSSNAVKPKRLPDIYFRRKIAAFFSRNASCQRRLEFLSQERNAQKNKKFDDNFLDFLC